MATSFKSVKGSGEWGKNSYSGSRLNEAQEPHPQPPPRKRGGRVVSYDERIISKSDYWLISIL
ncbi:MAG: hypothetical protein ACYT04_92660, partial [Nostoc sp.]